MAAEYNKGTFLMVLFRRVSRKGCDGARKKGCGSARMDLKRCGCLLHMVVCLIQPFRSAVP